MGGGGGERNMNRKLIAEEETVKGEKTCSSVGGVLNVTLISIAQKIDKTNSFAAAHHELPFLGTAQFRESTRT